MASSVETKIRPFDAIMLDVGDQHWLYVEQIGNAGGCPAIFLHGGPGSGAQHSHRNIFDSQRFHTFLFDQRGAGRSHPALSTSANTTDHLVNDIEAIRTHFGIDRWLVVGGSWGSTLALAYAQAHPSRVAGMVLRAVFLGSPEEVTWAFVDGPRRFRPELYAQFMSFLPKNEHSDPLTAYVKRLRDPDPKIHKPAADIWHAYERCLSELEPATTERITNSEPKSRVMPTPIMEAHYIHNQFFLAPGQLRDGMAALKNIPGRIIQGRYDLLCPPKSACDIAELWPKCKLKIVDAAGHAMTEPGVETAMREAISAIADEL
ncbi:MAG: prolyl aminopeptidase [Alphaproteobacteria bacterium]|nr:prolyl aminopeptidase [Alphaproteobacteria bacterium]